MSNSTGRRVEMVEQFVRRHALALAVHHREADLLAQPRILDGNGGGALHRRMPRRQLLDPRRVDVVAAADDDVLGAAGDAQIALRIERAEIAGHEPAAPVEGVFGRGLIVEIAQHERAPRPPIWPTSPGAASVSGSSALEDAKLVAGQDLPEVSMISAGRRPAACTGASSSPSCRSRSAA